jgi:tRNA modification GTPase
MIASSSLLAALLTPRGRGAIASVRICGDLGLIDREELFRAANRQRICGQPLNRIVFGCWGRESTEDVVGCRCEKATLEIHCHGGQAAVERILQDLRQLGARIVPWQELVACRADALEAELHEALSRAVTWRTAEFLLHQLDGRLREEFESVARIEWSDAGRAFAGERIERLLRWSEFGLHLAEPWRVVIAGPPNVGKSSLMNALIGYDRSIVFDQPGTTRDVLTAGTAFDGWPVELIDTAGLRETDAALEAEGIRRAKLTSAQADLVLRVIDISAEPHELTVGKNELLVAQKCDLLDRWGDRLPANAIRVSALTGAGLADLQRGLVQRLVTQVPPPETPLPISPRQVSLLHSLQQALAENHESDYFQLAAVL